MFERVTGNVHFDMYLQAARSIGADVRFLVDESIPLAEFSYGARRVLINCNHIGVNQNVSNLVLSDKLRTSQVLERNGFPVPRGVPVDRKRSLRQQIADLSRPLVVKPISGSAGKGVTIGLSDLGELKRAIRMARKRSKKILVEEFVPGDNFRIIVFEGQVLDVVLRVPAFVTGDGESTIRALIEEKNRVRREAGLTSDIAMNRALERYLREQGLRLRSVPKRDQRVEVHQVCNMGLGGDTHRVPLSEIHPDNLELFTRCVEPLRLRFAGPDFITPDLKRSHREIRCAFNEVNGSPMLDLHYFADFKMDNFMSVEVLRRTLGA